MPKFRVTSPDGRTFDITAPDGATHEQALEKAKEHFSQLANQIPDTPMQPTPQPEPSLIDKAIGVGEAGLTAITGATGGLLGMAAGGVSQSARNIGRGTFGTAQGAADVNRAAAATGESLTNTPESETGKEYVRNLASLAAGFPLIGGMGAGILGAVSGGVRATAPIAVGAGAGAGRLASSSANRRMPITAAAREAQRSIAENAANVTPKRAAEIERRAVLDRLPVPIGEKDLIGSQIDRVYSRQETERLVAGQPIIGAELIARLERGQDKMKQNIEAIKDKTKAAAANTEASGEAVRGWVRGQYEAAMQKTNDAYNLARDTHKDKVITASQDLVKLLDDNKVMPAYKPLFQQAKAMGIIEVKPIMRRNAETGAFEKVGERVVAGKDTVSNFDQFKTIAGQLSQSSDGTFRNASKNVVSAIYKQFDEVAPEFRTASKMRREQALKFENPAVMKKVLGTVEGRYGAKDPAVNDTTIPNYTLPAEKIPKTLVAGGAGIADIRYLRELVLSSDKKARAEGVQAIRELRGTVLDDISQLWDKTQTTAAKANVLDNYLRSVGPEKIELLFGKAGQKHILNFQKAAAIMNRNTPSPEGGSQTAGRMLNLTNNLLKTLEMIPIVGGGMAKTGRIAIDLRTASKAKDIPKGAPASRLSELANPNTAR